MAGEIQALYNQYQQRYPLYTRDAIVELMLDDGVITFDVANKIKSGVSLFLLDSDFFKPNNNNFSMTEIMGGNFTKTKTLPKTTFNRRIEPTKQPMTQGDCWLLSDINALSYTEFGRKAISDAIIPDKDGSGGVTIKFKGSPLKQKTIHINASEIDKARKSGNYSSGDDDMIAFELATEKTFKEMVKQGLAERVLDDTAIKDYGGKYRSFIFGGVKTKEFEQFPISKLLGLNAFDVDCLSLNDYKSANSDKDRILRWLALNKKNVSVQCGFIFFNGEYGNKNSKNYIHGGHAYAIKDINYGKQVTLTDPHYSDYEIKIPYEKFKEFLHRITFTFKDANTKAQFNQSALPINYEKKVKAFKENFEKERKKVRKNFENRLNELIKKVRKT